MQKYAVNGQDQSRFHDRKKYEVEIVFSMGVGYTQAA